MSFQIRPLPLYSVNAPLQPIQDISTEAAGVKVYLKREDLIHPQISGNKWRKLLYNLLQAAGEGKDTLLTFGGAYSNHIYAVAAAGNYYGFNTIGIIRGEAYEPLNNTLTFARHCGMTLHYVDRTTYRQKQEPSFIAYLQNQFGIFFSIPEGGSNALAVKGCAEIVQDIPIDVDYICCACGTGGTIAGLIASAPYTQVIGFSALKGGEFLYKDVEELLHAYSQIDNAAEKFYLHASNWQINLDYHFGGYAKINPDLIEFIQWFEQMHGVYIEQVYTGKMLYGLYDLLQKGYFEKGSTIVALHTGGLQGRSPLLGAIKPG